MTNTCQAPILSSRMTIEPEWVDHNGHLNMAYYMVLFDRGQDEAYLNAGVGPEYSRRTGMTTFAAECHIRYLRELHLGQPVIVVTQLLEADDKRVRYVSELRHADEGWVAATIEGLSLSVNLARRKVEPFPAEVRARFAAITDAHRALPWPDWAGRGIALKRT